MTMMIRWRYANRTQHTIGGVREVLALGVFGTEDNFPEKPLYRTVYYCQPIREGVHEPTPDFITQRLVFAVNTSDDDARQYTVDCVGAWLLDGSGNTVDTLLRPLQLDRERMSGESILR